MRACVRLLQEQKAKKAARQAKREPAVRYVPSQTYSSYGQMGTPLHEVSSYASSTHMGSPGYYSPVHPGSGERAHSLRHQAAKQLGSTVCALRTSLNAPWQRGARFKRLCTRQATPCFLTAPALYSVRGRCWLAAHQRPLPAAVLTLQVQRTA